jgi:Ca2+-binding RTX toxin-like protein
LPSFISGLTPVQFYGNDGNDVLIGGLSHDILTGGAGDDNLIGSNGSDTLIGGIGADTFTFLSGDPGIDTVQDFSKAEGDKLDISNILNVATSGELDMALNYVSKTQAAKAFIQLEQTGENSYDLIVNPNMFALNPENSITVAHINSDSALSVTDLVNNGNLVF